MRDHQVNQTVAKPRLDYASDAWFYVQYSRNHKSSWASEEASRGRW
jgi:hypothetical protein